ncbi:MAG: glycosyltransferase [Candidatus Moranbacteria bacterium]|nr:glycosyltransferase [Candidatus Moranbacteria bacterium]
MNSTPLEIDSSLRKAAEKVFHEQKVVLFIVAYNAEKYIGKTLSRIPDWCRLLFSEIYIIDDSSQDQTISTALEAGKSLGLTSFSVMKTPKNQGYGGNQKIGYTYALQKGYDIVILLHGDGQYPPECLPDLVACYADSSVDAAFGSRMIVRTDALRGGMPLYKWVGNQVLTSLENAILGTKLSEFHSGYRSYRTTALKKIPFHLNSDDFHFDTDIIIQFVLQKSRIVEIPMPTHYGDEECHVNGMKYAWDCFKSATKSRLHQAGIFFQPNFEVTGHEVRNYQLKKAKTSLHAFILRQPWREKDTMADLGANDGLLSQKIAERGSSVTAVDMTIPETVAGVKTVQMDLNENIAKKLGIASFNKVVALDIIEHLHTPEQSAEQIHKILRPDGILYASTANIGYIIMRFTLLLGWFNYGKKGILDRTHHRLFTIGSFKRLLQNAGFDVLCIKGFGPPIMDAFGNSLFWNIIDQICSLLAKLYPRLFAFNFLIIAKKRDSVKEKTFATKKSLVSF